MHPQGYIGRKMQLPTLKETPAIVIAAFGSTTSARAALDIFEARLTDTFPDHDIFWAYTSEIIRKKTGLPSLQQTLARVEAQGFRRAVVQPLHVFPGTEYRQMEETCVYFPVCGCSWGKLCFTGGLLSGRCWRYWNRIFCRRNRG